jgi:hypothetical protein
LVVEVVETALMMNAAVLTLNVAGADSVVVVVKVAEVDSVIAAVKEIGEVFINF